ncbi:MAG: alanine--tRNA ligase [Acidobacteria bacterium RIFCSPLOWO2_02_FULL_60_20]|nr:MAG: alanine--tRNA ligase [Acidobacteria bacterium RIFCSPLOWO2_02_FULL_60_20]
MTGSEIRKTFLDYFAARGHRVVKSSSLVPANDPTLLFTNAGMNQFKDVFLGLDHRDYARAASSQKCMRAGGKHNDLENVGRTRRHLTFFEMLGNFSFGDYFKKEAIEYAWELVTKVYGIPHDRLYITVFREDDEALRLWTTHAGVSAERGFRMDEKDNFWAMGDTGPCGPCSEIHYDLGANASDWGHADCKFPCECGRYVEIWNLVFMQYNRDASGKLTPLPKPSVDTGMGLERMASVLQGKLSVFETDLLFALVEAAAEMAGTDYGVKPETDVSLRILADHSRAAAFLINDGVLPGNDGRGYVLRKVLRRAVRHGRQIDFSEPFLYKLTGKVAEIMSDAYPELLESAQHVAAVVKSEEHRFAHTVTIALQEFEKVVNETAGITRGGRSRSGREGRTHSTIQGHPGSTSGQITLPGEKLFRLYDTFGMPLDWIKEIADERGLGIDEAGFEQEMQRQRERARASWKGQAKEVVAPFYSEVVKKGRTIFEGYKQTISHNCGVVGIFTKMETQSVEEDGSIRSGTAAIEEDFGIPSGRHAELVLDHTPFYAEAGGQVGDTGSFLSEESQELVATVEDTYYPVSGLIAHRVVTRAPIRVGDRLTAVVNAERREATKRNHTATHLLHAALRQVLGTHVKQAGSVVEPGRLRFDFSHFASVSEDELQEIEKLANDEIVKNIAVETAVMELDQALETGAMAFFGEKYPDRVRVVAVPGFSKELCGGTHVSRTGDIGLLKITHEGSISAGVRRVEAISGQGALEDYQQVTTLVRNLAGTVKAAPDDLPEVVEKLVESQRNLEKQLESLKMKLAQSQLSDLEGRVKTVKDVKVLAIRLDALERNQMRTLADSMRQKLKSGVVVLGSASDGKVALIAALTADLTKRLHAGKIAQAVAQKLGGTGGGRPDMAEGGGKDLERLDDVLNEVYDIIGAML